MEIATNTYQNGAGIRTRPNRKLRRFDVVEPVELYNGAEPVAPVGDVLDSSLPILATGNDIREVVRFLKNKPTGVTFIEAMNAEPRRVFDARKIAAYEFWGIVERSGERLRLSDLGQELAETIKPECEIHRRILRSIPTYLGALNTFYEQRLKIVTRLDARQTQKGLDRQYARRFVAS